MLRRFVVLCLGIVVIGLGIALFQVSELGTDPCTALVMAIGDAFNIEFARMLVIVNIIFFALEFIWGRKMIGIGTILNGLLVGLFTNIFKGIISGIFILGDDIVIKVIVLTVGVIVLSFAAALYQTANMGISPYDSLSLIISEKFNIKYFWARIITDSICVITVIILGKTYGIIGIGSIVAVLGMGPIIHFFTESVAKKLCGYK